MKALIADDDVIIQQVLKSVMQMLDLEPIIVQNGLEVLRELNKPNPPMLVTLDWNMPGMNGIDACKAIRIQHPTIPFYLIIVTAKGDKDSLVKALEAGASDFIRKPFDVSELRGRLISGMRLIEMQHRIENQFKANEQLIASINSILISVNEDNLVMHWNHVAAEIFGIPEDDALNQNFSSLHIDWDWIKISENVERCILTDEVVQMKDFEYIDPEEREHFLNISINPYVGSSINKRGFLIIASDVTEQKFIESQLMHSQKLESIGQLAAGIAHEINTPVQFVTDNTEFLKESIETISKILITCEKALSSCSEKNESNEQYEELQAMKEEADSEFLLEEIPYALEQNLEGLQKISTIVKAMKEFSFPTQANMVPVDLAEAIRNTSIVARNEWKYVSELELDFDENLPAVYCHPGELNQVFLNLIINSAHSIQEKLGDNRQEMGRITISTRKDGDIAEIRFSDTGNGIPLKVQNRIFDPFFTTKDVGKGTGQGLFISHSVIVDKHKGSISFETRQGEGTTFTIRIPIAPDSLKRI